MIRTHEEHLAHYGVKRRSGRYPWGSGDPETTRNRKFLDDIAKLKKQGMTEAEIAKGVGLATTTQLRAQKSIANAQLRQQKILTAQRHKEDGWSTSEIGRRMGLNESSVRALLAPGEKDKADALQTTANMLKDQVADKKYVDVGIGVERHLGVTRTRLDTSIAVLKEQGYVVHTLQVPTGPGQFTKMKVLAPPGTTFGDISRNRAQIRQITEYSIDQGRSFISTQPPISVNSRRIGVNYKEDGGDKADGVIYVRPGVKDLAIGSNRYAQVRIMVDGTHYLKGMAVYKDDLPDGVDMVFNTNKSSTGRKKDVMKEITDDPELPFGSIIRQVHGPDGRVISAMNIVGSPTRPGAGEEGSWDTWSRTLSSQMLSKQNPDLAKQQLDLTYDRRKREYDEINSLTNATVRKDLLMKFADQTDAASVHLKAANLPRQANKVIMPVPSMKPNEVFAPTFRDGESVVLIRHPHGGTFEIPQLKVNNRNREARKILGPSAKDAIGIHHSVAQRLSGADFDGDTVIVIPNKGKSVTHTPALQDLKSFDPQVYKRGKDSPIPPIDGPRKQKEMGKISNLITDMTIKGAGTDQIARAIKHSMVVIDSEKHDLDFRQSEKDHGILALKEEYQGGKTRGASTLISRAGARIRVPQKTPRPARRGGPIDPVTGKKVYELTGRTIPKTKIVKDPISGRRMRVETGGRAPRTVESKRLAEAEDAFSIIPGKPTQMESLYAEHSNRLKALANTARKEALPLKGAPASPSAKKTYANEVQSLDAKLNVALRNAPLERQAQLLTSVAVSQKRRANPDIEPEEVTKIKQQALNEYRNRTGASKTKIKITQSEWDAIQAGAISKDKLQKILNNTDPDGVKQLAMPRTTPKLTSTKLRRAQSMLASGYTQIEIADALGIGLTTLKVGLSE